MATGPRKILIVDDDRSIRLLLERLLASDGDVQCAEDGQSALRMATKFQPQIVLLDILMPGIDGYEVCRQLKTHPGTTPPQVIMISSKSSKLEQEIAFEAGADDYIVKPFDTIELKSRVRLHKRLLDARETVNSATEEIRSKHADLQLLAAERQRDLIATQDVAVFMLAKVAESRDQETGDHLYRMRAYSQLLAEHLQSNGPYRKDIDQRFLDNLYRSSPLHDIGKVAISDTLLLKQGRLTEDEFELIKRHTTIGANILDEAVWTQNGGGFLAMGAVIARFHHEQFDGSGYPAGLIGDEIPLAARIVAVADVYDALTSVRPYKKAMDPEAATQVIESSSGGHFDPVIVQAFLEKRGCFKQIGERYSTANSTVHGAFAFLGSENQ